MSMAERRRKSCGLVVAMASCLLLHGCPDAGDRVDAGEIGPPVECAARPDFFACRVMTSPDREYDICVAGGCVSPGCGDSLCNPPPAPLPVPDTGQRSCFGASDAIPCPGDVASPSCGETRFCGQDAQRGWDCSHAAGERFRKDEPVSGEPVVADDVTGLVWQGCPVGSSGPACATGDLVVHTWDDAVALCDALSWAERSDWRLPSTQELTSLLDYGRAGALTDSMVFPRSAVSFWTVASDHGSPDLAWAVDFLDGGVAPRDKRDAAAVRCVRELVPSGQRFARTEPVPGEPIILDVATGLGWQPCAAGLAGPACEGRSSGHDWPSALSYCENQVWGGYDDWFLPDVLQLRSIADDRRSYPSVVPEPFPNMTAPSFWSSTSSFAMGSSAWIVDFAYGTVADDAKDRLHSVLCARAAP